jgi:uncharacterized protein YecE (DUF72 family)
VKIYVGTGGWAYLETSSIDKLRKYSQVFDFVEVNSTFYTYPSLSTVRSWRRRVPKDFIFSVKCNRDLTHKYLLKPNEDSFQVFDKMKKICQELKSQILVLQTPYYLQLTIQKLKEIEGLLNSIDRGNLILVWDIRSRIKTEIWPKLSIIMKEQNIVEAPDLTISLPKKSDQIIYSRIVGSNLSATGEITIPELENVVKKIYELNPKEAYLAFHPRKMYEDARRFKKLIHSKSDLLET